MISPLGREGAPSRIGNQVPGNFGLAVPGKKRKGGQVEGPDPYPPFSLRFPEETGSFPNFEPRVAGQTGLPDTNGSWVPGRRSELGAMLGPALWVFSGLSPRPLKDLGARGCKSQLDLYRWYALIELIFCPLELWDRCSGEEEKKEGGPRHIHIHVYQHVYI